MVKESMVIAQVEWTETLPSHLLMDAIGRRGVDGSALSTANAVPIGLLTATGTAPARGIPDFGWSFAYRSSGKGATSADRSAAAAVESTRRVDDLVKALGCEGISKSQVSHLRGARSCGGQLP